MLEIQTKTVTRPPPSTLRFMPSVLRQFKGNNLSWFALLWLLVRLSINFHVNHFPWFSPWLYVKNYVKQSGKPYLLSAANWLTDGKWEGGAGRGKRMTVNSPAKWRSCCLLLPNITKGIYACFMKNTSSISRGHTHLGKAHLNSSFTHQSKVISPPTSVATTFYLASPLFSHRICCTGHVLRRAIRTKTQGFD